MPNFEQPVFSVVVPTFNRRTALNQCLERLAPKAQNNGSIIPSGGADTYLSDSNEFTYEVIVSDDSASGEDRKYFKKIYPWLNWTRGPGKGPAKNRNNGALEARGDWLVFLDDDCIPKSDLLHGYMDEIRKDPNVLVLEGTIKPNRRKQFLREVAPINLNGGYLWSCNFAIQREFFWDQLKGFYEEFPYPCMEDVDLRERIKKMGVNFPFCINACVIHPWKVDKQKFGIELKIKTFSHSLYYRRHPENKPKRLILIKHFIAQTAKDLLTLIRSPNILDVKYFLRKSCVAFFLLLYFSSVYNA